MFSKSCEYAIRAVIVICRNSKLGLKSNVLEIAKSAGVPSHYIAKLLQILTRNQIVNSIKGPGGGFFIDPKGDPIYLIELVNAIDGDSVFTSCGLGLANCSELNPCPLHNHFKVIRNGLQNMLATTTIQELSNIPEESIFVEKAIPPSK